MELIYTLLGDGGSDRRLQHPIDWIFLQATSTQFRGQWADLRGRVPLRDGLGPRVAEALNLYPCDILIIQRDAEAVDHEVRCAEIDNATQYVVDVHCVRLVPVRMQEAWFLADEPAIRRAAGYPTGVEQLDLPRIGQLEDISDPKAVLHRALKAASGHSGRRLRRFDLGAAADRVAELTEDFSPLRDLPAFARFEAELRSAISDVTRTSVGR